MHNLFNIPKQVRLTANPEHHALLATGAQGLRIEQIISYGHTTPESQWYDQEQDEWVAVLEGTATLEYADGARVTLGKGDHLFLPKKVTHRVTYTSSPCIWLAIHGDLQCTVKDVA